MDLSLPFRDARKAKALLALISSRISAPINIMEICGGHTHSLVKYSLLNMHPQINFIHGPGCPVCVMPQSRVDEAIAIASIDGVILCTLADMMRAIGSRGDSLLRAKSRGADIRALYTPLDALQIALDNPSKRVVFLAIGFETTTPMSAVLIDKALSLGITNLLFHINHVLVPEPITALLEAPNAIDAFLAPSHVSVIIGSRAYEPLARKYQKPFAVSGFEPLDMLESVLNLIYQHQRGTHEVYNQYSRIVSPQGNTHAQNMVARYFTKCDFEYRGLGIVPSGGLRLRDEYAYLDARAVFGIDSHAGFAGADFGCANKPNAYDLAVSQCRCGEILRGLCKPTDCTLFSKACTPKHPIGSCMVSSEGACAAYFKAYA